MINKIFDIIINSRFNPAGTKSLGETLTKSILNARTLERGFDMVSGAMLDMMQAADPERFERLNKSIEDVKKMGGSYLMQVVGPLIDGFTELADKATILNRIEEESLPIYQNAIDFNKKRGDSTADLARALKGMSDLAIENARAQKEANAALMADFDPLRAGFAGMKDAIAGRARDFEDYMQALRAAKIETASAREEFERFAKVKNIKLEDPFGPMATGARDLLKRLKDLEEQTTEFRSNAARERTQLLQNIAIQENRRLQDIARQNAHTLANIEKQQAADLSSAAQQHSQAIADLQQQAADQRVAIEENYQERIRQINESSATSIDDAIERRDARALSKALQSRDQQLQQAARDHTKEQEANEKNLAQQRAQIEATYKAQQEAARQAAQEAIAQQRAAEREQAEEARIADHRALEDFNLQTVREKQALVMKLSDDTAAMKKAFLEQQALYRRQMAELNRITQDELTPLGKAVSDKLLEMLDDVLGSLGLNLNLSVGGGS